jgi:hypothetical protein
MNLLEPQKAGLRRDAPGVRYKPAFKTVNQAEFKLTGSQESAENKQELSSK